MRQLYIISSEFLAFLVCSKNPSLPDIGLPKQEACLRFLQSAFLHLQSASRKDFKSNKIFQKDFQGFYA